MERRLKKQRDAHKLKLKAAAARKGKTKVEADDQDTDEEKEQEVKVEEQAAEKPGLKQGVAKAMSKMQVGGNGCGRLWPEEAPWVLAQSRPPDISAHPTSLPPRHRCPRDIAAHQTSPPPRHRPDRTAQASW